ncbi:MAG: hypothetical protein EXR93_12725 [Gemmatimonadetes bacterium]|nr:hypothetical protein [Gemmatimonadota bacterium]
MTYERDRTRATARRPKVVLGLVLAMLLVGSGTEPVQAQFFDTDRMVVTPVFGVVFPMGDMSDYVLPGPTFGVQVMYGLLSRFSIGLEGAFDSHQGNPESSHTLFLGPPYQMLRYGLAAEIMLLPPEPGSFTIIAGGGAGLATMFSEPLYNPAAPPIGVTVGGPGQTEFSADPLRFEGTYAAFNGLLRLAYVYDPRITLFAEGLAFTSSVDEEKTKVFVAMSSIPVAKVGPDGRTLAFDEGPPLDPPSSITSIGLRLGFRIHW